MVENYSDMPFPMSDLATPWPAAIAIVLASIGIASYAVRTHARRQRHHHRKRHRALARTFRRFLDGEESAARIARAADTADEGTYWTALETLSLKLRRPHWLKLSRALARARHAVAERRALRDDSPWRRALAARRLSLLRSRASWRALRRALVRGPEMVTHAAATALAHYHDRGALRWILSHESALAHRHRNALVALLQAFGRPGLPVMARALERGIHDSRVELAVVDALGLGGHARAREALERRLAEGDLDLRAASARALGRIHAVECTTSLIAALRDEAWQVRAQAARALGCVRAPLAVPALAARLTDPSWWVRHHSAYALKEMAEDGQAALRHVVASSADPYARDMAHEALTGEARRLSA
jgi:HEAT repeat protein